MCDTAESYLPKQLFEWLILETGEKKFIVTTREERTLVGLGSSVQSLMHALHV